MDKAAALVIGDEILSGSIADTNTPWLAKLLHSQGVDMVRFEYVPDQTEEIAGALHRLKTLVGPRGVVFTSGAQLILQALISGLSACIRRTYGHKEQLLPL